MDCWVKLVRMTWADALGAPGAAPGLPATHHTHRGRCAKGGIPTYLRLRDGLPAAHQRSLCGPQGTMQRADQPEQPAAERGSTPTLQGRAEHSGQRTYGAVRLRYGP